MCIWLWGVCECVFQTGVAQCLTFSSCAHSGDLPGGLCPLLGHVTLCLSQCCHPACRGGGRSEPLQVPRAVTGASYPCVAVWAGVLGCERASVAHTGGHDCVHERLWARGWPSVFGGERAAWSRQGGAAPGWHSHDPNSSEYSTHPPLCFSGTPPHAS